MEIIDVVSESDDETVEGFIRSSLNYGANRGAYIAYYKAANGVNVAKMLGFKENKENIPQNAMSVLADGIEVYIPFEELVDLEAEKQRLQGEREKLLSEVARGEKMLSNPGFVNKAPEAKINEEKAKLEKYTNMMEQVKERLAQLR